LGESAIEDGLGDAVEKYLYGSTRNHPSACTSKAILNEYLVAIARATHDLQRFIGNLKPGAVAHNFCDGRLLRRRKATVSLDGRPVQQELSRV
jgi:hypothetical protein